MTCRRFAWNREIPPRKVFPVSQKLSTDVRVCPAGIAPTAVRYIDFGRLDDAGFLHVTGRIDDVIVKGGQNVSPGEIEAVLVEHPAVADAAAIGLPDRQWGERIVAAVVLADASSASGALATAEELQELVRNELRSNRTPDHVEFVAALPYNDTGKLLRRVLRTELAHLGDGSTA